MLSLGRPGGGDPANSPERPAATTYIRVSAVGEEVALRRFRFLSFALRSLALSAAVPVAITLAPPAQAGMQIGHYTANIEGRYDFHTWIFTFSSCNAPEGIEQCAEVSANPMPIAKAYQWYGRATQANGIYTLIVDVPDGLRCGNVYYGPVIPTHDVYRWDAATLTGTLESTFDVGCDNAPGGTFVYPFSLVRF